MYEELPPTEIRTFTPLSQIHTEETENKTALIYERIANGYYCVTSAEIWWQFKEQMPDDVRASWQKYCTEEKSRAWDVFFDDFFWAHDKYVSPYGFGHVLARAEQNAWEALTVPMKEDWAWWKFYNELAKLWEAWVDE